MDTFTHCLLLYIINVNFFRFNVNFFEQNDATHNEVHQKLGESYYDHQKWSKAAKCFEQVKAGSGCTEKLIDCYFKSEQWQQMIDLGKYSKRRSEHREWSSVVKISIPPPSFKPVLLSLYRSPLL